MSSRLLVTIRRTVPLDAADAYYAAWTAARGAVTAAGAHAWRYRGRGMPDRYVEFLEFREDESPLGRAETAEALRALDAFGPGEREVWEDATAARIEPGTG